ncbi:MAG: shikimate kinase [Lachnospiraceae bacterium]|nr:shikimate kinase [Lachnospiraceae bacterium]
MKRNIVLIGMPGCGKSTAGVVLAKALGCHFVDADLLIQAREGRLLCEIIEEEGLEAFNRIEEEVNASIQAENAVIATGGSVVYGARAMEHLREIGDVLYIRLSLESVAERLGDLTERGVSMREGQTLEDLYAERVPLYEKYADITVDAEHRETRDLVREMRLALKEYRS